MSDIWEKYAAVLVDYSTKVKKGDFVTSGQTIGQIGLSGLTEFPHLHINVQQGDKFFDPFTGRERYTVGSKNSLWNANVYQQLIYKPLIIYNVGVSDEIPKLLDIRNEKYKTERISFFSNMMIFWVDMFHVETNDVINIVVKNPDGNIFLNKKIVFDKSNAKKLFYVGKRKPSNGFSKGRYTVQISFKRPNTNISDNKSFSFTIY